MLFDTVTEMAAAAYRQYDSPGNRRLRVKDDSLDATINSSFPIPIPPDLRGRAMELHANIALEKIDRAVAHLTAEDGVQYGVEPAGTSQRSERDRETVEQCVQGIWRYQTVNTPGEVENLEYSLTFDLIAHSRGWVRVLPDPTAWSALADHPDETGDKAAERVEVAMAEAMESEPDDELTEERRKLAQGRIDAIVRSAIPISYTYCPAKSIIPQRDGYGLAAVWEFRTLSVREVLSNFRDEHGNALATELQHMADASNEELTLDDVVTVVIHADRQHIQIAVLDMLLDSSNENDELSVRRYGSTEEIIHESEHHMGRVPYALFPGRERPSPEPAQRYHPLIDFPVDNLCRAYDYALTQYMTGFRAAFWPARHLERGKDANPPQGGDMPPAYMEREGGINTSLGPDEKIVATPFFTSESLQLAEHAFTLLEKHIDRATFGGPMYGTDGASSGYDRNLKAGAADQPLLPFQMGKELGFSRLAELTLAAARALFAMGLPAMQVRVTDDDTARYVTLTPDLVAADWDIRAQIRPTPEGGEYALFQTLNAEHQAGMITELEMMKRLGIKNPEQMRQMVKAERLANSPQLDSVLVNDLAQRLTAMLAQRQMPSLPQNPILPQSVATMLGGLPNLDPAISARLPDGMIAPPAPGGAMPQLGAGPPPVPQLAPPPGAPMPGGGPAGQAAVAPGGISRQMAGMAG